MRHFVEEFAFRRGLRGLIYVADGRRAISEANGQRASQVRGSERI